jgi:hypothetical protein
MITYNYYINYNNYYVKTRDVVVESYFDFDKIMEGLKRAGFKNVQIVDANLTKTEPNQYAERIYVVASHK